MTLLCILFGSSEILFWCIAIILKLITKYLLRCFTLSHRSATEIVAFNCRQPHFDSTVISSRKGALWWGCKLLGIFGEADISVVARNWLRVTTSGRILEGDVCRQTKTWIISSSFNSAVRDRRNWVTCGDKCQLSRTEIPARGLFRSTVKDMAGEKWAIIKGNILWSWKSIFHFEGELSKPSSRVIWGDFLLLRWSWWMKLHHVR